MSAELHGDDYARGARLDFAVNVSADPWPDWLTEAIALGTERLRRYPDEHDAVEAVAERHGRDPAEVVLLNGAAQGFTLLAGLLRPRAPVVVHPSFTEPERALTHAGTPPRRLILSAPFALDVASVPPESDFVVVGNPTNPTGVLHRATQLEKLCRPGRTTIVDEAFMDYVPGEPESLARRTDLPGLVVVRSLTKILGVPGVRAGYLLAPAPLAASLRAARSHWSLNSLALEVIAAASRRPGHLREVATATAARRQQLAGALAAIPALTVHPGSANFLLLELADGQRAQRRLRSELGIATRPGWDFPGLDHRHLRVAVRGRPLDDSLAHALAEVAAG